jgi:hypothetical protein
MGAGTHEDALTSGLRVASVLPGVRCPLELVEPSRVSPPSALAVGVFGALERSGLRWAVGAVGGAVLGVLRAALVVDSGAADSQRRQEE